MGLDDNIGANIGIDGVYLTHLIKTTFVSGPMDNNQRPLTRRCFWDTLHVRDKLYRNCRRYPSTISPRCEQNDGIFLRTLVQRLTI